MRLLYFIILPFLCCSCATLQTPPHISLSQESTVNTVEDVCIEQLFSADVLDRKSYGYNGEVARRDLERKDAVVRCFVESESLSAIDLRRVSMIFHHGTDDSDYIISLILAKLSLLYGGDPNSAYRAASAYDRWAIHNGKNQAYGTQFECQNGILLSPDYSWVTSDPMGVGSEIVSELFIDNRRQSGSICS